MSDKSAPPFNQAEKARRKERVTAVTTSVSQPPVGYTAATTPSTDPVALMQSYMQYYNQPAPSGYTPEQWAAAQQQGWAQWQQWQQQYQQWQAQYGDKYQETMKQISTHSMNLTANQAQLPPQLPYMQPPPPLPKEDTARPPPLPPATTNTVYHQFANMPPPNQNNLPLFPAKEAAKATAISQANASNYLSPNHQQPPPLPNTNQQQQQPPPLPPEIESRRDLSVVGQVEKRDNVALSSEAGTSSAKKFKSEEDDDELTEAERTFDAQFKEWEEQFNKWKQQNANHPDKTQYKQYEAKWTSWREKLLERREQMRKKREQQKQVAATKAATTTGTTVETEKSKNNISSDDKIFNILSNTENQRLINNVLGIGKTLGLTGKQQSAPSTAPLPLPPPPPPPPAETTNSDSQGVQQALTQQNVMGSNSAPPPSWSNQQWSNNQQYNPRMETPSYGMPPSTMHHHSQVVSFGHQATMPNFAQPPPNLPNNNGPSFNFSQPPPNFPINNKNGNQEQLQNTTRGPTNTQDHPPNMDIRFAHHERSGNFDGAQQSNFFRREADHQDHRFVTRRGDNISNSGGNEPDQLIRSSDTAFRQNDIFNDRLEAQQRFRRGDRNYGNEFGNNAQNNFPFGNDGRFGPPINERFAGGNNRFVPIGNDRFTGSNDRFGPNHDRLGLDRFAAGGVGGSGNERFIEADRFGRGAGNEHRFERPDNERFGLNDRFDRFADRPGFGTDAKDRFSLSNEHFGSNDRFAKGNNADCFDPKDMNEHRRDTFGNNPRGFGRNPSFSPSSELPPGLKKLMEKRKAAGDVFKPSFLSDSERNSSVGSLSESFKKIAGESPFRSFDFPKIRPVGLSSASNFSNNTSGSGPLSPHFQAHSSSSDPTSSSYNYQQLRGANHPFNNNSNAHDNEPTGAVSSGFRQAPFLDNFGKHGGPIDYNERQKEKNIDTKLQNLNQEPQSSSTQSQSPSKYNPEIADTNVTPESSNKLQIDNAADAKDVGVTRQINEINDLVVEQKDNSVVEDSALKKNGDDEEKSEVSGQNDNSLQQQQQDNKEQDNNCERMENKKDNTDNIDDSVQTKKSESLPFIGENDPRPEDLNIEPPPELPNLGPVLTNMDPGPQNIAESLVEVHDKKIASASGTQFHDMRSREMEFKVNGPFRPQESPPMFNPRVPHALPVRLGALHLQSHANNAQLGPNEGQFGSNASDDSRRLSPKRSNIEQFSGRDDNDRTQSEHIRNSNNRQFGSMDEQQFGQFSGLRGKFGQVGPRFPIEFPFTLRNPAAFRFRNDAQFGPRGANDGSCGIRGPSDAHSHLGVRHPGDAAPFGFMGYNNNRFGRPNEIPFDKRPPPPPFDNIGAFSFSDGRPVNEGSGTIGPPRGPPPDTFSQGRRSPKSFSESRFDSRNPNDRSFEHSDFKDKSLAARSPMGDSNYSCDYVRRSGPYTRREQFESDMRQFENPTTGPDRMFDRDYSDRNPVNIEARKDNVDYARRTPPQDPYKKELDNDLTPRLPPYTGSVSDAWTKNKFNDDQRKNLDRNVPSNIMQFDERSRVEPKIMGDFRPSGYGGSGDAELDRQSKFHSSSLFVKRSQSMRSSGTGPHNEFCVPRQYNYNHGEITDGSGGSSSAGGGGGGGGGGERKFVEYTPAKVIDYGHASRPNVVDYHLSSPVQCFDYAHGDLKPVVPVDLHRDHHYCHRTDFRNWTENEQSIKDYTDKMRICYDNSKKEHTEKSRGSSFDNYEKSVYDIHRSLDYNKQQRMKDNTIWQQQENDKRPSGERERRDIEDYKERSSMYDPFEEQRFFERDSNASDRHSDRSIRRERPQETCESSRKETNKDNDKDSRSKGSVNWQENLNKNIIDTKLQDNSLSDTQKNVAESTTIPRTLELSKMSNYTMVDDLLCPPGRQSRPSKIAIILRGPPGSGKSFVAKLIKDKEVEQGGSAPRILSLDDYFLIEKEIETKDDNGKKVTVKEMVYEYEEAMEQSYITSLVKAFKKNITDGFFNFIILDCINEKISDYEEMWNFAKTKGFKVYVCEMEMDLQICLRRNIHNRTEDEINRIIDYFEPTPSYHLKLDVNSMLQEQAIEEVDMEDSQQEMQEKTVSQNEDSQDSHEDAQDTIGVSKWEKMEAEDKLDRLDGLAKKKSEARPQTMEDFLQVPDYYNMEDTSGKKRVRWADLEERKEQEKMRAVGFVVGYTNWDRMMDPTKGGSALTRTKYI